MKHKIAYLGPHGTYTEEATCVLEHMNDIEAIPYPTIIDCLWATYENKVDGCVVPVENSIQGSVLMTLDTLVHEVDVPIHGEIVVPVEHTLYATEDIQLDHIGKVYSHPQALAQCRSFLRKHMPNAQLIEKRSTAEACEYVSEQNNPRLVAIGTPLIKSIYPLVVLEKSIQDYDNNFTRFLLCGIDLKLPEEDHMKTSLIVTLPQDFQGALYQVLAAFAWRKLNLIRIESRPTKKKLGNYYFFIDLDQPMDDVLLPGAIAEIEALGCFVRLLGSFPSYTKTERKEESTISVPK